VTFTTAQAPIVQLYTSNVLQIFNPGLGFVNTVGAQQTSPDILLLNILIELRVANAMAWDAQRGLVTQTPEQYRSDMVNEI
jgi:hypothetical protein